jgi:Domain of unknown function (DUF4279)
MSELRVHEYKDDYATCLRTFATLRIFSGDAHPDTVTARLGLRPTKIRSTDEPSRHKLSNSWQLCSELHVQSRDNRRHVDWLLDAVEASSDQLRALMAEGAKVDIICFFEGIGRGGPTCSVGQMHRLANLGLMIWWDTYCDDDLPWDREAEAVEQAVLIPRAVR